MEKYLGLINYFRDFIPCYSTLAAPLESLRKIPRLDESIWTKERRQAFLTLKAVLREGMFLHFPDFDRPFHVATDASDVGIGAALYQLRDDAQDDNTGNRHYNLFAARALHPAERNYSASKKELLAVVFALKRFHFYLWGRHFKLFSDHRALSFLFTQKDVSPLLGNWIEIILSYNFQIIHRPGIANILPDILSRLFPSSAKLPNMDLIGSAHQQDRVIHLPSDRRVAAMEEAHLQGHFGVGATLARLIQLGQTWPGMRRDVELLINRCVPCQRFSIVRQGFHPLNPITSGRPMDHVAVDTALSFPVSVVGKSVLLVCVCVHTRFCFLRALQDKSASSVAEALFLIFCDFGFPRVIQSDNGSEFVNQLMNYLAKHTGIDHRLATKYHPRANGLAERFVQTSCRAIHKLLSGEDRQWDRFVPIVQVYMNSKIAAAHARLRSALCLADF